MKITTQLIGNIIGYTACILLLVLLATESRGTNAKYYLTISCDDANINHVPYIPAQELYPPVTTPLTYYDPTTHELVSTETTTHNKPTAEERLYQSCKSNEHVNQLLQGKIALLLVLIVFAIQISRIKENMQNLINRITPEKEGLKEK